MLWLRLTHLSYSRNPRAFVCLDRALVSIAFIASGLGGRVQWLAHLGDLSSKNGGNTGDGTDSITDQEAADNHCW